MKTHYCVSPPLTTTLTKVTAPLPAGVQGFSPPHVYDEVRLALAEGRLYRCLRCDAVLEQRLEQSWLRRGGYLHRLATEQHGQLSSSRLYRFPLQVG